MVLERPGAKQPAASRPTAARRPQRHRSCLGSRFEIFSTKPAHLNNGWRGRLQSMYRRPQVRTAPLLPPLHLSPSLPCPDRLPTLLQPRLIEWAQAPTRSADWRRSLASWAMRAASWARRCRSASSRRRVGSGSLGRGGARGQQLNWGWRTLQGELGGLYGVCCHIISLPNL